MLSEKKIPYNQTNPPRQPPNIFFLSVLSPTPDHIFTPALLLYILIIHQIIQTKRTQQT